MHLPVAIPPVPSSLARLPGRNLRSLGSVEIVGGSGLGVRARSFSDKPYITNMSANTQQKRTKRKLGARSKTKPLIIINQDAEAYIRSCAEKSPPLDEVALPMSVDARPNALLTSGCWQESSSATYDSQNKVPASCDLDLEKTAAVSSKRKREETPERAPAEASNKAAKKRRRTVMVADEAPGDGGDMLKEETVSITGVLAAMRG
jgi:hypothetical protein